MSEKTIGDLWRNAGEAGTAILAVRNDSFAALTDNNLEWSPLCVDSAGRVQIGTISPGFGATNLGKREDDPHVNNDVGVQMLGVIDTSAGSGTGAANGDYAPPCMTATGALYACIDFNSQASTPRGLLKQEDSVHTSADAGVQALTVRSDGLTAALTSATGDYASIASGPRGQVYVNSCAGAGTLQATNPSAIVNLTSTQILAAAGAGLRNYIQTITCINESATATRVDILDGATVIWRFWMAAGSTQTAEFPTPLRPTANTAVNAQCSITGTSTYVSIAGFADA